MTHKDKLLYSQLLAAALLALFIAFTWFVFTSPGIDAAPAPTSTLPIVTTPTPSTQHWLLENDGDTAYLLTQPGCYLTMQELGQDSRVFTLECDPVGGEGVEVRLKDGQ